MNSTIDHWKALVNGRISATLDATARAVSPVGAAADDLLDVIRASSAGGKRLRAILVLASHEAHGGGRLDQAAGVAAAVELFQTAALLHDDVLDDSDTRRGQPAGHRVLAAMHAAHGWHGSAASFGASGGILAGDIALMSSHRALHTAVDNLDTDRRRRAATLFADMTELVTAGQYLDMRIAAQPFALLDTQEQDIRATMRSKTASYSAEFPLALGATLGGASAKAVEAVRAVGVPLGMAFQLRDDVLGLTGAPAVTGKPAGDDIREGKRTLIAWNAWRAASATQRATMMEALGKRDATPAQVTAVVDIMRDTGALAAAESEIRDLTTGALAALRALDLREPALSTLASVFEAATMREA